MAMVNITISGHPFDVPTRYEAGHVLAENEAKALNQTFAESVRNNIANRIRASLAEGVDKPVWTDEMASEWQNEVLKFAQSYVLGVRSARAGRIADPETKYALEEASAAVAAAHRNANKTVPKPKELRELALKVLEGPQGDRFRSIARSRVRSVQKEAAGLMDIMGDLVRAAA